MARIWIVNPFEAAASEGFPQSRYQALAETLSRRNHEVLWWSCDFSHYRKAYERSPGRARNVTFLPIHASAYRHNSGPSRLLSHAVLGINTLRCAQKQPLPHAILATAPPLEVSAPLAAFAQRRNVPFCLDVTDVWPESFSMLLPSWTKPLQPLLFWPHRRLLHSALRDASSVSAISHTYLAWAQARRRASFAHRGVFPWAAPRVAPHPRQRDASARPLRVVFVGTLGITYDLPLLARSARYFDAQRPGELLLEIVGDGPRKHELLKLLQGTSARYLGSMGARELDELLRQADVGLCPYVQKAPQSLPIKLYTYLSYGLPVVETLGAEMGGLLEVHEMGASASDDASFFSTLERLLDSPKMRQRMGTEAIASPP
jgi:glycosyltransferase involved in cell wall biosynthesis